MRTVSGMTLMYVLMSAFNSVPWLKLIRQNRVTLVTPTVR
jgi:hypothetical protein